MSTVRLEPKSDARLPFHFFRTEPKTELRGPFRRTGLTKTQAEELMDWLDAQGHSQIDVSMDDEGFNVEFE